VPGEPAGLPVPGEQGKEAGMRGLRIALWVVGGLAVIAFAAFLNFYLPSTEVVRVTGTDVKRMDAKRPGSDGVAHTRDVRFISAMDFDGDGPMTFRNEDTGWGFPFYFKFDSGDVTTVVQNILAADPSVPVAVTYYGWRIQMLDWYPNAVTVRRVSPDYVPIPYTTIVVLVLLAALAAWLFLRIRRWRRARY